MADESFGIMETTMHKELAQLYNQSSLTEIANAAKAHADLINKYSDDKRFAKVFGDVYLSLNALIDLAH